METTSKTRRIGAPIRPTRSAGRPANRKAKRCPLGFDRHAFLKQGFRPLFAPEHGGLADQEFFENSFYASADKLCRLYGLEMPSKSPLPYPMNLSSDYSGLKFKLEQQNPNLMLRFVGGAGVSPRLATLKTFDTGNTLFYLPIAPLLHLLEKQETQSLGELLLSVYSYLFRIVRINHFCSAYSYLGAIYEMIEEWCLFEEGYFDNEAERRECELFFARLWEQGKVSLHLLSETQHLECFAGRVAGFEAKDANERDFKKNAGNFSKLYLDYPNRSICDNIQEPIDGQQDEPTIRLEQYLHFFWDFDGMVYDTFIESINAELGECSLIEEPTTVQYFDNTQTKIVHDLDFEERLFELLHALSDNLKDLKYD